MTSLIIPYDTRPQKHTELIFALRSIEKYLSGYGEIFIIGAKPEFLTNVTHIPYNDDPRSRYKDRNIMLKIIAVCKDKRVSDDFLMWHDDHMLLEPIEASTFPTVHHGRMNPGPGQYGETKNNTIRQFCIEHYDRLNDFDSHCPILFNKEKFLKSVPSLNWNVHFGYCIKTVYCKMNGIQGEYYEDLKIRHIEARGEIYQAIHGRRWFSTSDTCFQGSDMKDVLNELYPEPSRYEIQKPVPPPSQLIKEGHDPQ